VVFTLVLMVTMTFWNGIATLLDEQNVDFYDMIAMWIFMLTWFLFSIILTAVIFNKVYYRLQCSEDYAVAQYINFI